MEYTNFIEKFHTMIKACVDKNHDVKVVEVTKNNGVILTGIAIRERESVLSPTIYVDSFYQEFCNGATMESLTTAFLHLYEEKKLLEIPDVCFFQNYQEVKHKLALKLINRDKNSALLQEIPHIDFLDLAITFYCNIGDGSFGNATVTIRNEHMKGWKVNIKTLYADAMENAIRMMPPQLIKMEDMLLDFMKEEEHVDFPRLEGVPEPDTIQMTVLTNANKFYGAAGMIFQDVLQNYAQQIQDDFYILPSSIHEVILVPQFAVWDEKELGKMVKEVNETQLEKEDVLSDSVYYYDRFEKSVVRCM